VGRRVIAFVRRPEQMGKLVALGLKTTTDITKLFDCEVVISMLPDDDAVRDVVFGRADLGIDGLALGLMPGPIHLSMSTISTATASQLASDHARHAFSAFHRSLGGDLNQSITRTYPRIVALSDCADLAWIATLEVAMPKNPVISMLDDDSSACEGTMDLLNSMGFTSRSNSLPPHCTVSCFSFGGGT
jgi:hypothetical protein